MRNFEDDIRLASNQPSRVIHTRQTRAEFHQFLTDNPHLEGLDPTDIPHYCEYALGIVQPPPPPACESSIDSTNLSDSPPSYSSDPPLSQISATSPSASRYTSFFCALLGALVGLLVGFLFGYVKASNSPLFKSTPQLRAFSQNSTKTSVLHLASCFLSK
jgi:hypothetical protein